MSIFALWCLLAFVVAVAANARGRSGIIWLLVALFLSPPIALILVIAMRNVRQERLLQKIAGPRQVRSPTYLNPTRTVDYDAPPKARWGGKASRVTIDRTPKPFEPEGVYSGIPYRVAADGGIEAIMQGATVRFASIESFISAVGKQPA